MELSRGKTAQRRHFAQGDKTALRHIEPGTARRCGDILKFLAEQPLHIVAHRESADVRQCLELLRAESR